MPTAPRSKTKKAAKEPTAPTPASAPTAAPTNTALPDTGATLLRIALVGGLLWYSLLAYLIATSNPVSLNVRQIAESDAIVHASVGVKGGVRVEKSWRGNVENGPLDVAFPAEASKPGEFIIPLRRTATGWEITPTRIANGVRLVYPASETVIEKLEALLDETQAK